jgi:hypothetical protein
MSYILEIWEQPSHIPYPQSADAVAEQVMQMQDVKTEQNPKFILLADMLVKQLPDLHRLMLAGDESSAWTDSPLDGYCDDAVYNLGIDLTKIEEILPLLLTCTQQLKLSVSDPQTGEAWLGNGIYLEVGQAAKPVTIPVFTPPNKLDEIKIPNNKDVQKLFIEQITPFMKQHGFQLLKKEKTFVKYSDDGYFLLKVAQGSKEYNEGNIYLFASGVHWSIERLKALALQQPVPQGILDNSTYVIDSQVWLDFKNIPRAECPIFMGLVRGGYRVENYNVFPQIITHFQQQFESTLLHLFEQASNLPTLYYWFNKPYEERFITYIECGGGDCGFSLLFLAYLIKSADFLSIIERHSRFASVLKQAGRYDHANKIEMCIDYVEQHLIHQS